MLRRITISWLKQRSGSYALKGIKIGEDNRAYDSTSTFREEDARWLTSVLGADANVELSSNSVGERNPAAYPEWALKMSLEDNGGAVPPLDLERAGAAILRHALSRLVVACGTNINGNSGLRRVMNEANAALSANDAGTFYTSDEARAVLGRRSQGAGKTRGRL